MEANVRFGKYPGEFRLEFLTDGWGEVERKVGVEIERAVAPLLSDLISWRLTGTPGPDEMFSAINGAVSFVEDNPDDFGALLPSLNGTSTYSDALDLLHRMLKCAVWFHVRALWRLAEDDIPQAVSAFGSGQSLYGKFKAHLSHLTEELNSPPSGPAHALAHRLDQILKPGWLEHCKSVVASGLTKGRLDDLLNVPGYDSRVTRIKGSTLNEWAKNAGFEIVRGRPKVA